MRSSTGTKPLQVQIKALERQVETEDRRVTPEVVEKFGELLVEKLLNGTSEFRQAYVRLLISKVVLSPGEISIFGSLKALERAVTSPPDRPNNLVPRFVREWCPEEDSNLHALASAST